MERRAVVLPSLEQPQVRRGFAAVPARPAALLLWQQRVVFLDCLERALERGGDSAVGAHLEHAQRHPRVQLAPRRPCGCQLLRLQVQLDRLEIHPELHERVHHVGHLVELFAQLLKRADLLPGERAAHFAALHLVSRPVHLLASGTAVKGVAARRTALRRPRRAEHRTGQVERALVVCARRSPARIHLLHARRKRRGVILLRRDHIGPPEHGRLGANPVLLNIIIIDDHAEREKGAHC
mmetsp:Transcript_18163/g.59342  ORF Transcript_18163/g.59342 Transcript_18163/m.59342 type:complete len:238 (-) Transcript_18163:827-1540(-)